MSDGDQLSVFASMMQKHREAQASQAINGGKPLPTARTRPEPPTIRPEQAFEQRKLMAKSRPRPNDGRYKAKLHGPRDQQLNTAISEGTKLQLVALKDKTRKSIADLLEELIDEMYRREFQ